MRDKATCRIYLDTRRPTKEGLFPVNLEVYQRGVLRNPYSLELYYSKEDFFQVWESKRPRKVFAEQRKALESYKTKANSIIDNLSPFNIDDFKRLMFGITSTKRNVNYFFAKKVDYHTGKEKMSTANSYEYALKSLLKFHGKGSLNFKSITPKWLREFEKHCTKIEGNSVTTVGIYLRNLRAVFNDALSDDVISSDVYPFGKNRYQIPSANRVKKALTAEQLKTLFEGKPQTPEQAKAKAFWFFSYFGNGMNMKDILSLRCANIDNDTLTSLEPKQPIQSKTARQ